MTAVSKVKGDYTVLNFTRFDLEDSVYSVQPQAALLNSTSHACAHILPTGLLVEEPDFLCHHSSQFQTSMPPNSKV